MAMTPKTTTPRPGRKPRRLCRRPQRLKVRKSCAKTRGFQTEDDADDFLIPDVAVGGAWD